MTIQHEVQPEEFAQVQELVKQDCVSVEEYIRRRLLESDHRQDVIQAATA